MQLRHTHAHPDDPSRVDQALACVMTLLYPRHPDAHFLQRLLWYFFDGFTDVRSWPILWWWLWWACIRTSTPALAFNCQLLILGSLPLRGLIHPVFPEKNSQFQQDLPCGFWQQDHVWPGCGVCHLHWGFELCPFRGPSAARPGLSLAGPLVDSCGFCPAAAAAGFLLSSDLPLDQLLPVLSLDLVEASAWIAHPVTAPTGAAQQPRLCLVLCLLGLSLSARSAFFCLPRGPLRGWSLRTAAALLLWWPSSTWSPFGPSWSDAWATQRSIHLQTRNIGDCRWCWVLLNLFCVNQQVVGCYFVDLAEASHFLLPLLFELLLVAARSSLPVGLLDLWMAAVDNKPFSTNADYSPRLLVCVPPLRWLQGPGPGLHWRGATLAPC